VAGAPHLATPDVAAPPPRAASGVVLAGAAAAVHALFDLLGLALPWVAPPYLRLAEAPDAFRDLPPLAVIAATSCVSGAIDGILVAALEPAARRPRVIGALVGGFWLFSAALCWSVWFATPLGRAAPGLALAAARGAAAGWALARLARGPARPGAAGAA
jgi:hypothetical protein